MFTTDSYGLPSNNVNCPVRLYFSSSRKHVFVSIPHSPLNCQELWRVWNYLGANKLTCHSFMDACRRYETSLSKNCTTHGIAMSMKVSIYCAESLTPSCQRANMRGPDDNCSCSGLCSRRGTLNLGTQIFITGSKHAWLCTGERHYLYYTWQ